MSTDTQNSAPVSVEPIVTLNGAQLLQALDFIAPDRDTDPTQLEGDVSILYGAGHAGSGYYCYLTDYPDEGAIMLDAETADDLISSDSDPALTQQTLDDVKAGIPARDAEIAALRKEIEALQVAQAQQPVSGADGAGLKAVAHELKIHPEPFKDLSSGAKTSEVRNCADRQFNVGDVVRLREYEDGFYTGTELYRTITHIQHGYGMPEGLCVLSYGQYQLRDAVQMIEPSRDDAMERALSELVDKIMPGLDTGDLLADAATASKALDTQPSGNAGELPPLPKGTCATEVGGSEHNPEIYFESDMREYARAALAQQDADKVDAERYRYLKARGSPSYNIYSQPEICLRIESQENARVEWMKAVESRAGLDAAIDAARKEQA